jgi:hypothetical protein
MFKSAKVPNCSDLATRQLISTEKAQFPVDLIEHISELNSSFKGIHFNKVVTDCIVEGAAIMGLKGQV